MEHFFLRKFGRRRLKRAGNMTRVRNIPTHINTVTFEKICACEKTKGAGAAPRPSHQAVPPAGAHPASRVATMMDDACSPGVSCTARWDLACAVKQPEVINSRRCHITTIAVSLLLFISATAGPIHRQKRRPDPPRTVQPSAPVCARIDNLISPQLLMPAADSHGV